MDLHQSPAFQFTQRPRFHDPHSVASLRLVLLIVRVETSNLFHDLAELRMRHARRRLHDDRFVHPIGNHFADARLASSASVFRRKWRWLSY